MFRTQRHGERPVPVPGIRARDVCGAARAARKHCKVAGHLPLSRVVAYSAAKAAALKPHHVYRLASRGGTACGSIPWHPGLFPAIRNRRSCCGRRQSPTARATGILDHTPIGRFRTSRKNWRARSFSWHATLRAASSLVQISVWTAGSFVRRSDSRVAGNVSLRDFSSLRENTLTLAVSSPRDLFRRPNSHFVQMLQHVSRVLINTISAGLFEFFRPVAP